MFGPIIGPLNTTVGPLITVWPYYRPTKYYCRPTNHFGPIIGPLNSTVGTLITVWPYYWPSKYYCRSTDCNGGVEGLNVFSLYNASASVLCIICFLRTALRVARQTLNIQFPLLAPGKCQKMPPRVGGSGSESHSPLLVPRSRKSRAIPLSTLCATPGL